MPIDREGESKVCRLFLEGKGATEIARLLPELGLTREKVYDVIQDAAKSQRFWYTPGADLLLSDEIQRRYHWLHRSYVVPAAHVEAIASVAVDHLLTLLRNQDRETDRELHIGFAGGGVLMTTARLLAEKIEAEPAGLPSLCFHALVASFSEDPAANPNSFLGYFAPRRLPVSTRIVGLQSPGFVHPQTAKMLQETEGIKEAYEQRTKLDIVVTSAGAHWKEGCSSLHQLHTVDEINELNEAGCIGDLMWRPIGGSGPIENNRGRRAMTLLELSQLPELIREGKRVLLVIAPCGRCGLPKFELLKSLLSLKRHLFSDLVVDRSTALALKAEWGPASVRARAGVGTR